jgi:hypothetical protein
MIKDIRFMSFTDSLQLTKSISADGEPEFRLPTAYD